MIEALFNRRKKICDLNIYETMPAYAFKWIKFPYSSISIIDSYERICGLGLCNLFFLTWFSLSLFSCAKILIGSSLMPYHHVSRDLRETNPPPPPGQPPIILDMDSINEHESNFTLFSSIRERFNKTPKVNTEVTSYHDSYWTEKLFDHI